jgi:hypothetical protein
MGVCCKFAFYLFQVMKKQLLAAALGILTLSSCSDPKAKQKALLDDIITMHDKAMDGEDKAQSHKMKLDTMLKTNPALKEEGAFIRADLMAADSTMEDWMHKFDPEYKGKSDEEKEKYLNEQKKQLSKVEAQLQAANDKAAKFITKYK